MPEHASYRKERAKKEYLKSGRALSENWLLALDSYVKLKTFVLLIFGSAVKAAWLVMIGAYPIHQTKPHFPPSFFLKAAKSSGIGHSRRNPFGKAKR